MKILVADDDKEIVELLSIYIHNEGYEVVKAYDGKEALSKLHTTPDIDLLILDIMMPIMDGMEVKTIEGKEIQLTALEFGILYLLASHPNRVFSADEIFERVWQQESIVSAKTVMVHVSHLRDKIEEATGGEKVIQTVWGVGYKIDAR